MLRKLLLLLLAMSLPLLAAAGEAKLPAYATTIRSLAVEGNGRLWVATFGKGLWQVDAAGPRRFEKDGQPFPMVNNLMLSGEKLYIATAGGGCLRLDTTKLEFEPLAQTPGFEKLHALMQASDSRVFIGSVGSGTAVLNINTWQPMKVDESSQLAWVNSIVEWQNQFWLGTATGLYRNVASGTWRPQAAELRRAVNCLLVHDGILYAGTTDRGVFAIEADGYPRQVNGTLGPVHFLLVYGDELLAGGDLGLWSIKNVDATEISAPFNDAKCAAVDTKKILYVGTVGGKIYKSDDARNFIHTMSFTENGLEEQKQ